MIPLGNDRLGALIGALFVAAIVALPCARADDYYESSDSSRYPHLYFGAGTAFEDLSHYSSDAADDSNSFFGSPYFNLQLMGRFNLSSLFVLSPNLMVTPIGVSSPDKGETTRLLAGGLRAGLDLGPVDLLIGPGIMQRMVSAPGGTITLNNGNGTSVFALPPKSDSMTLLYLDGGLGLKLGSFRFDADVLITDLAKNPRRAADGTLTVSYGFF